MNEWLKVAKKYWRAIVLMVCLVLINNSYGQSWGESSWKSPDYVMIHQDKYGFETSREVTQHGITYNNSLPINSTLEGISRILLVVLVFMYWRQVRRRFIAIPYVILFAFIQLASSAGGDGPQQFGFALIVMGIVIFTKRMKQYPKQPNVSS